MGIHPATGECAALEGALNGVIRVASLRTIAALSVSNSEIAARRRLFLTHDGRRLLDDALHRLFGWILGLIGGWILDGSG